MTTQAATPATEVQVEAYTAELLARLGVGPGASMEELERAHDQRLDFLAQAPAEMSDWAQQEIGRVDEAYALLTDPHADIPAAAAAALADRGGAQPAPEASAAPAAAAPQPPAWPTPPRSCCSSPWPPPSSSASTRWAVIPACRPSPASRRTPPRPPLPRSSTPPRWAPRCRRSRPTPRTSPRSRSSGTSTSRPATTRRRSSGRQKALEIEPQDVTALLALGAAQFNSGDSAGAEGELEEGREARRAATPRRTTTWASWP